MLHTISSDVNGTIRPARKAGCSWVADGTRLSDWVYQRPVWQSYQTEVVCTEFGKLFCRKNLEKVLHLKSLLSASMQWGWRGRRLKTRGSSSGKESAVPAQTLTQPLPPGQTGNFLQLQKNYKPKCGFFQEGRFNSCDSERALCLHGDRSDIGCQWALVTRQL